jgi:hypothetical protein
MFDRLYLFNTTQWYRTNYTSTLNQLVKDGFQNASSIQDTPVPLDVYDQNYVNMLMRTPSIIDGYKDLKDAQQLLLDEELSNMRSVAIGLFVLCVVGLFLVYLLIVHLLLWPRLQYEAQKAARITLLIPEDNNHQTA